MLRISHPKFKNIMHRKGAQDKKRSSLFSKLSKEITVAAKMGGGDIDGNPRLRLAVQNARGQSMPKDNIQRAISKSEAGDAETYEEIRYEGYAPGGVAVMVECMTDNRNRTEHGQVEQNADLARALNSQFDRFPMVTNGPSNPACAVVPGDGGQYCEDAGVEYQGPERAFGKFGNGPPLGARPDQ